jgi:hypothetical protein
MQAEIYLWAAAGFNVAFGLFHVGFWRFFNWREELPRLRAINRGVLQVLNLMLIFVFFAVAALQIGWTRELLSTPLGRAGLGLATAFWLLRFGLQLVFWPRTRVGWAFALVFAFGAGLHAAALGVD